MTKKEAIAQMMQGQKLTHRYFSDHEWITIKEGSLVTEEGYKVSIEEFFSYRYQIEWEEGWELYTPIAALINGKTSGLLEQGSQMFLEYKKQAVYIGEERNNKNQLRRCKKGLHEYKEVKIEVEERIFKTLLTCIHCEKTIEEKSK